MSRITILETDYATVWYYPEKKIVHHVFHKYIYGEEFRKVLMIGLETFREKGADKWLSDDRKNSALPQADLDWGLESWFPGILDSGWKYWAVVAPDKIVGKANMKRIISLFKAPQLTTEAFESPEEALKWLESV